MFVHLSHMNLCISFSTASELRRKNVQNSKRVRLCFANWIIFLMQLTVGVMSCYILWQWYLAHCGLSVWTQGIWGPPWMLQILRQFLGVHESFTSRERRGLMSFFTFCPRHSEYHRPLILIPFRVLIVSKALCCTTRLRGEVGCGMVNRDIIVSKY